MLVLQKKQLAPSNASSSMQLFTAEDCSVLCASACARKLLSTLQKSMKVVVRRCCFCFPWMSFTGISI